MAQSAITTATSGIAAQLKVVENVAYNLAQFSVPDPMLVRTQLVSGGSPTGPGAGVRAETQTTAPTSNTQAGTANRFGGPQLDPRLQDALGGNALDLVQNITDSLFAQRAFEANLTVLRTADAFMSATLNLKA